MEEQATVAAFLEEYDLYCDPAYRALDLTSEVGEITKEVTESTGYGSEPTEVDVPADELGDALFSLLALADSLDVDAGEALAESLEKYRSRLEETGSPASGSASSR